MKFWELYVRRVHDLKPVLREELGETCDPDDLIYEVQGPQGDLLTVTEVGVCVTPETRHGTKYECYANVTRDVTKEGIRVTKPVGN